MTEEQDDAAEARWQRAADRLDIADLSSRYMRGLDRLQRQPLAGVFWPDAWLCYGIYDGEPEAFVDFCMEALKSHQANQHMLGQIVIDFDDDPHRAYGEVYYQAYHRIANEAGEPRDLFINGRYVDRYERRDDEWRIIWRSELVDWTRDVPAADEWFVGSAMLPGARCPDDPIYHRARMIRPAN